MIYQPFAHIPVSKGYCYDLPPLNTKGNIMTLTEFGKAVRKARVDANETLLSMANAIGVSPAFLSAAENGHKKVSDRLLNKIMTFFEEKNIKIKDLQVLAHISNGCIPINKLPAEQQKLIARLANLAMTQAQLNTFIDLLNSTHPNPNRSDT